MSAERTPPLRVLHVFGAMDRGGAETRTLEIMQQLDRRRVTFDFCVLSGRAGAYAPEIEALGGRILSCPLPAHLGRLPHLLRAGGWDVVHSHVHHFSGAVLTAARWAGVRRRVAHLRTTDAGTLKPWRRRAYEHGMRALIDANATCVIAVSEAAMESFFGPPWRTDPRRLVIYNGVDTTRFSQPIDRAAVRRSLAVPPAHHLVLHVGNFHPAKNHPALIAAAARLTAEGVGFTLVLVGDGPERPAIEALVRDQHLEAVVRFLGTRDDVADLLGAADVFVFPSRWEGLPGAVLEALAAGLPVVASPIPPVQEIARQARGITCVDPNDVGRFTASILRSVRQRSQAPLPPQFTAAVARDALLECYG